MLGYVLNTLNQAPEDDFGARKKKTSTIDWSSQMISGRSLLRRARQRRVLSKHIKRSNSFTVETTLEDISIPCFIFPTILALFVLSIPVVHTIILYVLYNVLRKLNVFSSLRARYEAYRKKRSSRNGPSIREKCYYYLDYWISTNP